MESFTSITPSAHCESGSARSRERDLSWAQTLTPAPWPCPAPLAFHTHLDNRNNESHRETRKHRFYLNPFPCGCREPPGSFASVSAWHAVHVDVLINHRAQRQPAFWSQGDLHGKNGGMIFCRSHGSKFHSYYFLHHPL